jgi:hypothetical protein
MADGRAIPGGMRHDGTTRAAVRKREWTGRHNDLFERTVMTQLDAPAPAVDVAAPPVARPNWRTALGPLVLDLGLPVAAYYVARDAFGTSMVTAFIASSIASFARMVFTAARDRKLNGLSALVLGVNLASIALNVVTGSVRVVAARDAVVSSVVAFGILLSVLRGRPVLAEGVRPFVTKGEPDREAAWDRLWMTSPRFRRILGAHSAVWGVAFVLDCVVRVICAATAPLSVLGWIGTAATIGAILVAMIVSGAVAGDPLARMVSAAAAPEPCACD